MNEGREIIIIIGEGRKEGRKRSEVRGLYLFTDEKVYYRES